MNTNGGRTSYGHAFGASGLADIFEAVTQMRGEAGERQVKRRAMPSMEIRTLEVNDGVLELENVLQPQEIRLLDIQYRYAV